MTRESFSSRTLLPLSGPSSIEFQMSLDFAEKRKRLEDDGREGSLETTERTKIVKAIL